MVVWDTFFFAEALVDSGFIPVMSDFTCRIRAGVRTLGLSGFVSRLMPLRFAFVPASFLLIILSTPDLLMRIFRFDKAFTFFAGNILHDAVSERK